MRPLVALDIGSTKVACAIGLPHEHAPGFELLGTSLVPYPAVPDAWVGDPLMVGRAIEQALEATAVSTDVDRAIVAMTHPSLASEHVRTAVALGDEPVTVRTHDLDRLQQSALAQALGVDREPLLVERLGCAGNGFEGVRDPCGLSATRLLGDFHIVTMPTAARRALVQAVESAGLEVSRLLYALPLTLAIAADASQRHQRILAIDVGGLNTDVGLMVEGALRALEVVPWGGVTLASAIAKDLRVTMDQAAMWSLEGAACRKPGVPQVLERQWKLLQRAIDGVLKHQPQPDAVLLTGRAALIDGFAEWVEQATGVAASLCRSARTSELAELSRQVGLSTAIAALEAVTSSADDSLPRSPHLLNRLIHQTRTILTEYF